jgi:hypothetical protein
VEFVEYQPRKPRPFSSLYRDEKGRCRTWLSVVVVNRLRQPHSSLSVHRFLVAILGLEHFQFVVVFASEEETAIFAVAAQPCLSVGTEC